MEELLLPSAYRLAFREKKRCVATVIDIPTLLWSIRPWTLCVACSMLIGGAVEKILRRKDMSGLGMRGKECLQVARTEDGVLSDGFAAGWIA